MSKDVKKIIKVLGNSKHGFYKYIEDNFEYCINICKPSISVKTTSIGQLETKQEVVSNYSFEEGRAMASYMLYTKSNLREALHAVKK